MRSLRVLCGGVAHWSEERLLAYAGEEGLFAPDGMSLVTNVAIEGSVAC